MAEHASKRQKLEHVSSEEDSDDSASFASFGEGDEAYEEIGDESRDDEVNGGTNGADKEDLDGLEEGESDGEYDAEGDDFESIIEDVQPEVAASKSKHPTVQTSRSTTARSSAPTSRSSSYTAGTFKSSLFKLQVDELLEQIRPKHGKREAEAEATLHTVKQAIEKIPAREPLLVEDAERSFLKTSRVKVPFPVPRPAQDAKYKLGYARPSSINVIGSYALKTASRAKKTCEIDMIVVMPASLFQEKDYLDYRYFYKRSYYLACIAAGLEEQAFEDVDIRFVNFHGNPMQQVIAMTPKGKVKDSAAPKWQINIIPCAAEDAFSPEKLLLNRSCVRQRQPNLTEGQLEDSSRVATAFYNSTLRAEMIMTPYLQLLNRAAKTCDAFRDACLLGSTWLRQRGLASSLRQGGFGTFEFSALMALLLQGGGPGGRSILSDRYTSYQLLKATLQVIASKDMTKQPLVIGTDAQAPGVASIGTPILWDSIRNHNLLYKMTQWSYKALRQEVRTTLNMLSDTAFDPFDSTFILRADSALYRYDYVIQLDDGSLRATCSEHDHLVQDIYKKLYETLQKGLGDRARQINIIPPTSAPWQTTATRLSVGPGGKLVVAIVVNPKTINRVVDHGPSAAQKSEAAVFRKFWGEKAELRRFKDGSILETLVWSGESRGLSVLEQMVRYVLHRHLGEEVEQSVNFIGEDCRKILRQAADNSPFAGLMSGFKQLESDVRGLDGLPLSVRQISAAHSQLRYASVDPKSRPADVVLQFEGSSRWPDDLVAIQRTKIAFLLKLSEQLDGSVSGVTARIGLENEASDILNQAFLDVVYESRVSFRIRIYHDREQTLLERRLKDKVIEPSARDAAVYGLAKYKRDYLVSLAHSQAFAGLCSQFPALSGIVRLAKQWFASHLLSNHVSEEVIELIVARTFVQPWPWQAPSSVQTGFYRTLNWLSRWDWRHEPLVVDLGGGSDLKEAQRQSVATNFEAWRKLDPALNRVVLFAASNVDPSGTTWTDGRPLKVIASRMTALAKAARTEIESKQLELDPASLFTSALSDFDFVLHIDPEFLGRKRQKSKQSTFKNLEIQSDDGDTATGLDPLVEYTNELENLYGSAVLFFSGGKERPLIAGLWNPQTTTRAWTLNLSYSTTPLRAAEGEKVQAEINKEAILAEIARLGGDMVKKIEVNKP